MDLLGKALWPVQKVLPKALEKIAATFSGSVEVAPYAIYPLPSPHPNASTTTQSSVTVEKEEGNIFQEAPIVASVISARGGLGKTTTAISLATELARQVEHTPSKILLVDGNVTSGSLALRVAQRVTPNLLDLLNHMDSKLSAGEPFVAYEDLASFILTNDNIPQLDILAAPENPDVFAQMEPEDLEHLIQIFSRWYDVIIFDCGSGLQEFTHQAWLTVSHHVFVMMEPEITCLHSSKKHVEEMLKKELTLPQRVHSVMLRLEDTHTESQVKEIMQEMFPWQARNQQWVLTEVRKSAIESANQGSPLSIHDKVHAQEIQTMLGVFKVLDLGYSNNLNEGTIRHPLPSTIPYGLYGTNSTFTSHAASLDYSNH